MGRIRDPFEAGTAGSAETSGLQVHVELKSQFEGAVVRFGSIAFQTNEGSNTLKLRFGLQIIQEYN